MSRFVTSKIHCGEVVRNDERAFGSALSYYPAYVRIGGKWMPALFTSAQIDEATARAQKNPEDMPPRATLANRLLGWITSSK